MDERLHEQGQKIKNLIEKLAAAEEILFNLECSEDAVWGAVFLETKGHGPVEDRKAMANTHANVKELRAALGLAKKEVLRLRRLYALAEKAGDWEYGTYKIEEQLIKREGRVG